MDKNKDSAVDMDELGKFSLGTLARIGILFRGKHEIVQITKLHDINHDGKLEFKGKIKFLKIPFSYFFYCFFRI